MEVTWSHTDDVALAVSGGVDSMVLLHLLQTKYRHTYDTLTLLHVNHQQRQQSEQEEAYIRNYAASHNLKLYVKRLDFSKERFSQASARDARYHFFESVMQDEIIKHLLTAHHKDDDYETIAHQLFSGRTPTGIEPVGTFDDTVRHRPLINYRKSELYEYADKNHITYFEDKTNQTNDYTRNFIRNEVLAPIDLHDALSIEALEYIRNDYHDMDKLMARHFSHIEDAIDIDELLKLTMFEQVYIIKKISNDAFLSRKYIEEVIRVAASGTPNVTFPIGNTCLKIEYNKLCRFDKKDRDASIEITKPGSYVFNDHIITVHEDMLPLTVRTHEPGDKMALDFGTKKVARMFIDAKIASDERMRIPIVTNTSSEIIAVGTMYNIIEKYLLNIERMTIDDT